MSLVQLITMCRFSISATVSLARSAESSSAAIIRPLPRTSTIASCRPASERNCCLEVVAHFRCVRQQTFILDCVDHRDRNGAGQRSAAKGGAVHARMNRARHFFCAEHRSQRNAACERLRQRGDVRLNAVVLIRAPLAGATHARLNLIHNEQAPRLNWPAPAPRQRTPASADECRPHPESTSTRIAQTSLGELRAQIGHIVEAHKLHAGNHRAQTARDTSPCTSSTSSQRCGRESSAQAPGTLCRSSCLRCAAARHARAPASARLPTPRCRCSRRTRGPDRCAPSGAAPAPPVPRDRRGSTCE